MNHRILLVMGALGFHFVRFAQVLKRLGNDVFIISDDNVECESLPSELDIAGIVWIKSQSIDRTDFHSTFAGAYDIKHVFNEYGPFDIVHVGGVKQVTKVFLALLHINKKPLIGTSVGFLPVSLFQKYIAAIAYNFCPDVNVAFSAFTKLELTKLSVNENKIVVIPLFNPDLDWFDRQKTKALCLSKYSSTEITNPVVVYAASHFDYKRFDDYLYAARDVLKRFDSTFILGGQGPQTENLKKLAKKLGIDKNVIFTGWIPHYDMPSLLSNTADICVSTSTFEQLPSFILECMAAGKPIVSTAVAGVPEIVVDHLNGYLVPMRDYKATAESIAVLLDDPIKRNDFGRCSRFRIEHSLNMQNSALMLLKYYEQYRSI